MSKIKSMALAQYDSIYEAVCFLRNESQLPYDRHSEVERYSPKALEDVLFLLVFNDIRHSYTTVPYKSGSLVSVSWVDENKNMGCISWYEYNEDNQYYLIKYCDDYADEFEVEGFMILNGKQMDEWESKFEELRKCFNNHCNFEFYFGTNEWVDYSSFEDFNKAFDTQKITKNEAVFLSKLTNNFGTYGIIPTVENVVAWIEDAKDREECL